MRDITEIESIPGLVIDLRGDDGGHGWIYNLDLKKPDRPAQVQFSWGCGWDHVSVSWPNRCPTWDEMCKVKSMFFHPEEICVEYHPSESEYVNQHPYCLHLWRYQQPGMPMPPSWMLGLRKGQTMSELQREIENAYS